MICNRCGYKNTSDAAFCEKCGNKLFHNRSSNQKNNRGIKFAFIVLIIVIAICAAVFAIWFFYFNGSGKADNETETQTQEQIQETMVYDDDNEDSIDGNYEMYADGYCHIYYFDTNGGTAAISEIYAYEGEEFSIPSITPTRAGYSFVGWNVNRLVDDKWYYKSEYKWMTINEGDAFGYSPSLYTPGQEMLLDDSWKKGNVDNSNYVFVAVWRSN